MRRCSRAWRHSTARGTSRMANPPRWYIRDLHTNACGDFLLMGRRMWHTVRGFPLDDTVLSLDCDSLIMHEAAALGSAKFAFPRLPRFQGRPRAPLLQSHHPGLVAPGKRRLDGSWPMPLARGAADLGRMMFNYPKRRVRGVDSIIAPLDRTQFRQARRTMGPWRRSPDRPAGKLGAGRSASRGKTALPRRMGGGRRRGRRLIVEQAVFLVGGQGTRLQQLHRRQGQARSSKSAAGRSSTTCWRKPADTA